MAADAGGNESKGDDLPWDWDGVSDAAARELQRQGEAYISSQLTTSIAADQRAMTTASVFAAVSAGLAASAATVATVAGDHNASIAAITAMAVGMLVAGLTCAFAARPVAFYGPGYNPKRLLVRARNETELLRSLVKDLEELIGLNAGVQRDAATLVRYGYGIGVGSILIAPLAFYVAKHLERCSA